MLAIVPFDCQEEVESSLKDVKVMLLGLVSLVSESETLGAICWEAHLKHNKVVRATTRWTLDWIIGIARVRIYEPSLLQSRRGSVISLYT